MRTAAWIARIAVGLVAALSAGEAAAQNNGGVFPPLPGDKELEYRIGWRPGENGAPDRYGHRLHYQERFADRFLWRGVVQASDADGEGFDFDLFQVEVFWELTDPKARWRTGLRLDGQVREGSEPETIALNWANQFRVTDRVSARFNVLTKRQFGDRAAEGILVETRTNIFARTDDGIVFGVESYNLHGGTKDFDFYGDRQQIGPFAFWPLGGGITAFTGALFGVNERSPDIDLRFWLRQAF